MVDLPHAVETVIRIVDCQDWRAGIGFGHTPVALEHDDFGPDLVVDLIPFVEHFLNVFLFVVCVCARDAGHVHVDGDAMREGAKEKARMINKLFQVAADGEVAATVTFNAHSHPDLQNVQYTNAVGFALRFGDRSSFVCGCTTECSNMHAK